MTEIWLHIDELTLHGFDPRQRHALADAVQSELARLLAESAAGSLAAGPAPLPLEHRQIDAGAFDLPHGALPATAGSAIAAAVHAAIEPLLARSSSTEARDG